AGGRTWRSTPGTASRPTAWPGRPTWWGRSPSTAGRCCPWPRPRAATGARRRSSSRSGTRRRASATSHRPPPPTPERRSAPTRPARPRLEPGPTRRSPRLRHRPPAAPEVPRRHAAIRPPRLGPLAQGGGGGQLVEAVVLPDAGAQAEVGHRQHVEPAEAEDEEHLRGPAPA